MFKSMLTGFLFGTVFMVIWNAYDIETLQKEVEELNKRLDEKTLLCLKEYEIKSRHNLVLKCDEVK